jgi:hypothetical protein
MPGSVFYPKVCVLYSRPQSEESPSEIQTGHRKRISFLVTIKEGYAL